MRPLTADMTETAKRPYFLWDEDLSIDEFRQHLRTGTQYERERLLGKLLREARDVDVWHFVSVREVVDALSRVDRRLGRRRAFWHFLIDSWSREGLIGPSL